MSTERCGRCASVLTFVGFDRNGDRVGTCTANVGVKKGDGGSDSAACNLNQDFVVRGQTVRSVLWLQRHEEVLSVSSGLARCRAHGMEMTIMRKAG